MKRLWSLLAAILMAGLFAFASVGAAQVSQAADRCSALVVDDARILGSQTTQVESSVKSLEEVGAEGRVITIQSFSPYPNLDEYVNNMIGECASWRTSGQIKANLFILAISMDERKVMIRYGDTWLSRFQEGSPRIQSADMAPRFKQGDYAGGMIAGIEAIKQLIQAPEQPARPTTVPANPDPRPTNVPNTGGEGSPAGAVFLVILLIFGGIVAAAVIAYLIYRFLWPWIQDRRERRRLRAEAETLSDQVKAEYQQAADTINSSDHDKWFEDFDVAAGDVEARARETEEAAVEHLAQAADSMYSGHEALQAGDDESAVSHYEETRRLIQSAVAKAEDLRLQHDTLLSTANKAALEVDEVLQPRLSEINTTVFGLAGIDISDIRSELDSLQQRVGAQAGLKDAPAIPLLPLLPELRSEMEALVDKVTQLQSDLAFVSDEPGKLQVLHQAAIDKRIPAVEAFERMSAAYAKSSWENIAGNGTKAEKLLFRAKEMLDRVAGEPVSSASQVESRLKSLAQIKELVVQGDDLLDDVIEREANIAKAQHDAEQEIALAQSDIDKADDYLREHGEDVDPKLTAALVKARGYLDISRRELSKDLPNYLAVVKQALLANGAADEVLARAVEQHEYLESVRRQLATTRTLFATSYSKSERYIRGNRAEVDSRADRLLEKAKAAFALVDKQADEVGMLEKAKEALELANSAYDSASDDVAAAEAEREAIRAAERARRQREEREERERRERREREEREERERRNSYYSSTHTYSSSSSSSFGGGGSSSSFGGFGGGGSSSGW